MFLRYFPVTCLLIFILSCETPTNINDNPLDPEEAAEQGFSTLAQGRHEPGRYNVNWDASGMASGMYFYIIRSAKFTATRKLLLMK